MNRSEVLKALEWVDKAARDGDEVVLGKAKLAFDDLLKSHRDAIASEEAYKTAVASFTRKHGREPLEELGEEE